MVSVVVCFMDSSAGYIMTSFNNLNDLWWGYSGTAGGASPCHDTGCQCFTSFSQKGCFTEREIQNTMSRLHRNDMMNDTCVFVRRRQTKGEIDLTIRSKSERGRDTDLQTGRDRQWLRHFFLVQLRNAPILCLLHLLLRFGQHPKLMVIIIAVTLHRPCWCSRKGAVWHRLRKHCSCLTKHAFSYGTEMSGVTPINGGQENTEGLCCCLGREKVASRWPIFSL